MLLLCCVFMGRKSGPSMGMPPCIMGMPFMGFICAPCIMPMGIGMGMLLWRLPMPGCMVGAARDIWLIMPMLFMPICIMGCCCCCCCCIIMLGCMPICMPMGMAMLGLACMPIIGMDCWLMLSAGFMPMGLNIMLCARCCCCCCCCWSCGARPAILSL